MSVESNKYCTNMSTPSSHIFALGAHSTIELMTMCNTSGPGR